MKKIFVLFRGEKDEAQSVEFSGQDVGYRLSDGEVWLRVYKGKTTVIIPRERVIYVKQVEE